MSDQIKNPETLSFIDSLKEYNRENNTNRIWIPSLSKYVIFEMVSAKHQKMLIEAAIDNPLINVSLVNAFYDIIKETCTTPNIVDKFTIFDKDAILIQLRYYFVNKKYDNNPLKPIVDLIKKQPMIELVGEVTDSEYNLSLSVPTMAKELKIYNDLHKSYPSAVNMTEINELKKVVSNVYYVELIKYIDTFELSKSKAIVDFNTHSISENIEILNYISKKLSDKIGDQIKDFKENFAPMYKIDKETTILIDQELLSK